MAMLDLQRRHAEIFRIRLGDKGPKGEPRKLTDSIRITAGGRDVVQAFVNVYGGEVTPFDEQASRHNFQAYLPTTALAVMVLPGQSLDAWWELYRRSVCERRCDGFTEQLSGKPCMCPPDIDERLATKDACRPMTRINVLCPDVEVVGAGSLVTHGMIAAETLPQSIAVAEAALSRGLMVPAVLRIVEHKGKRQFIYPQLEIVGVSLQQLTTGEVGHLSLAAGSQASIGADAPRPAAITSGGEVSEPPPAPAPRTTPELPPLPGEAEGDDLPPAAEQPDWIERINSIPDAKAKGACMKQFRATFGGTQVPPGHEQEAAELIASFDGPAVEDEREKLRRGLMAQSTKAFPPDGSLPPKERTAKQAEQRHAVTYAVLGEFKSSNQMDVDELSKVTFWLHDVERGVVKVIQRDGVWVVEFNGGIVEVPPETLVLS